MENFKKLFPSAFKATETNNFIVALIVYAAIAIVGGAILGLLSKIAIIGFVFTLIGAVVDLYAFIGIVLSILVFIKVVK